MLDNMAEEQLFDILRDPHELNNLLGDPDFEQIRQRLAGQLRRRLAEIGDMSQDLEQKMVAGFNPAGVVPVTGTPVFDMNLRRLEVETPGASIGYRLNDGRWSLYSGSVDVESGDRLTVKAIRYGWQESEAREYLVR